jgi:hypothetical protein
MLPLSTQLFSHLLIPLKRDNFLIAFTHGAGGGGGGCSKRNTPLFVTSQQSAEHNISQIFRYGLGFTYR